MLRGDARITAGGVGDNDGGGLTSRGVVAAIQGIVAHAGEGESVPRKCQ